MRALMDLPPPAQFRVLDGCGVLRPDDWKKDYLTMITDAMAAARARGLLDALEAAVTAAGGRG